MVICKVAIFRNMDKTLVDIAQIVSGFGAFISGIVAVFTIREVRRQRESTYLPDLHVGPFAYKLLESFDGNKRRRHYVRRSRYDYEVFPDDKLKRMDFEIKNIGFASAKNISFKWHFDYKKVFQAIQSFLPEHLTIVYEPDWVKVKQREIDMERWVYEPFVIDESVRSDFDVLPPPVDAGGGFLPAALPSICHHAFIVYLRLKIGDNLEGTFKPEAKFGLFEKFENLPKPTLSIAYTDLVGKRRVKHFEFTLSYWRAMDEEDECSIGDMSATVVEVRRAYYQGV